MQALDLEGLARSVSVGMAYLSDKSRPKVVKNLRTKAEQIRRQSQQAPSGGGLRVDDLAKVFPIVDASLVKTSSLGKPIRKVEDFVKARAEIMKAKQAAMAKRTVHRGPMLPPSAKNRGKR